MLEESEYSRLNDEEETKNMKKLTKWKLMGGEGSRLTTHAHNSIYNLLELKKKRLKGKSKK